MSIRPLSRGWSAIADSHPLNQQIPLPPAAPDWSPVRRYGGYQARKSAAVGASEQEKRYHYAAMCACASACASNTGSPTVLRLPVGVKLSAMSFSSATGK